MRKEYPNFHEIVQFRNQYTITKNLNIPGVIKPLKLQPYQNGYALVMELGGISLKSYMKQFPGNALPINKFLAIAIQITTILDEVHSARVIHKDIKPANILINLETKQIQLIDFSIASLLPKETQTVKSPNVLEGTLAYLSPEQTGRMNRGIDYRSDFYSLGVTFYELLTGQLPFLSNDAMELIHCHIAKSPIPANKINSHIPVVLAEIINKLMAKNAENRYQSLLGLKFDLEQCLHQLNTQNEISSFELATRDISERFIIPEKLYGRETEVQMLLAAFQRVSSHQTKIEMMLVAGFSGIGKTAVVNEVHKPIVEQRGYFIKGKYDQFQRDIPFSAIVQALRDLMQQLVSENDIDIQNWKDKILAALGVQGQVITDVIPELELIIGKQPNVPQLEGVAAQNRFNLLFQKFIEVFTKKDHPLVIFLDDLQWADSASLKLIEILMTQSDAGYLLIIGAYRDNEVSSVHPLMLTLDKIKDENAIINTITLKPLQIFDLNHLVADTLNCHEEFAKPLTELIYQKTKGNPFFSTQFLKALYQDKLITFDFPQSQQALGDKRGCWQCDITKVRELALTDDVVEFIAIQLQKLPELTQEVLKLAACIGNQFELETLAIVCEKSQPETATLLWKALQESLVIPASEIYKFYQDKESPIISIKEAKNQLEINNTQTLSYKFLHDRIQQAAYSLIPEDKKQTTHLNIGRLLLRNTTEREEKVFDIVNHLNIGSELITNELERDELAQLNLIAGQKAKLSTAYTAANNYFSCGIKLLKANGWEKQYKLTLSLHETASEVSYLSGNFEQSNKLLAQIFKYADSLLDKVKAYEIKIQSCLAQNQLEKSVTIALNVLEQLGVKIPEQVNQVQTLLSLANTKLALLGKQPQNLIQLPEMKSVEKLAAMRILASSLSTTYIARPKLLPLVIFTMVNLSVRYGNTDLSAFAYAWYGLILSTVLEDIESGYSFGQLALQIVDKFKAQHIQSKVLFIVNVFINHWREPVKNTVAPLIEAYKCGIETGDIEYACWSINGITFHQYSTGKELSSLEREIYAYSQVIKQFKQNNALLYTEIYRQGMLNLLGKSVNPSQLVGEAYDETTAFPLQVQADDRTGIVHSCVSQLIVAYIFGEYSLTLVKGDLAEKYLDAGKGLAHIIPFYFYTSLARLALYHNEQNLQKQILKIVASNQQKIKKWAKYAPVNTFTKLYLVEAEIYRVKGKYLQAFELYDRAIAIAKENEYIHEEALGNELAAKCYLEWGKEKIAQTYMIEAYYCYSRWGAKAKVENLEENYPQLLTLILEEGRNNLQSDKTISHQTVTSTGSISDFLDLESIAKASQTISSEIEVDKVVAKLMQLVMESAGASKSVLMLLKEKELVIEAIASFVGEDYIVSVLSLELLEFSKQVPTTLINYVKNTLKILVINDSKTQFAYDSYLITEKPQSILCVPIINKNQLIGILYLENQSAVYAFTSERLTIINLICSQAAISLENARLYQEAQDYFQKAQEYSQKLEYLLEDLKTAQLQLVQSEKMSALGNLVAGVAHEINNPIGFIAGNIQPAYAGVKDLFNLINLYQEKFPQPGVEIIEEIETIDLEYLRDDLPKLILSMEEGVQRIRSISNSLRTFSRADSDYKVAFNIHDGLDSTILILKHRLKADENRPAIEVVTNYANLPKIQCFPGQLNQVFMNLLANAIDALEESNIGRKFDAIKANPNRITITTKLDDHGKYTIISIQDNGSGMSPEVQQKIFDHLYTTKTVGKGTGLGLAIARQIVVDKHQGSIEVSSVLGEGTEFVIKIPVSS
jgi:predicted ATPase/signal transduction histidine kinase